MHQVQRDTAGRELLADAVGAVAPQHIRRQVNLQLLEYQRKLQTQAGEVELKVPRLRRAKLETPIIERYRRRESSVEKALMEIVPGGVSVRRVEDITEALWGRRVSAATVTGLNQELCERINQ